MALGRDGSVDAKKGKNARSTSTSAAAVAGLDWSPDSRVLCIRRVDGAAELWRRGNAPAPLAGSQGAIRQVAWSPNSDRFVTVGVDGSVWLREADGTLREILGGAIGADGSVEWSNRGTHLAIRTSNGLASIWDSNGALMEMLEGTGHEAIAWRPDQPQHLTTGGKDGMVRLWSERGDLQREFPAMTPPKPITALAWSSVADYLAIVEDQKSVYVQSDKGQQVGFWSISGQIARLSWAPSSIRLLILTKEGQAIIWGVEEKSPLFLSSPNPISEAAWSPQGNRVATLDIEGGAKIWNQEGGLVNELRHEAGSASALAWSTAGDRLATAHPSGNVALWTPKGAPIKSLQAHKARISVLSWAPHGQELAAGGDDGDVRLISREGKLAEILPPAALPIQPAIEPKPAQPGQGAEAADEGAGGKVIVSEPAPLGKEPAATLEAETSAGPSPNPEAPVPEEDGEPPELHANNDAPITKDEDDKLGYRVYADVLASLIEHHKTKRPLTLAINGPWGSGKSSLANLMVGRLAPSWSEEQGLKAMPKLQRKRRRQRMGDRNESVVCWFNAWEHDDDQGIEQAFMRQVARTAHDHRRRADRVFNPLPWGILTRRQKRGLVFALLGYFIGVVYVSCLAAAWPEFPRNWKEVQELVRDPLAAAVSLAKFQADLKQTFSVLLTALPFGSVLGGMASLLRRLVMTAVPLQQFVSDPKQDSKEGNRGGLKESVKELIDQAVPPSDDPDKPNMFLIVVDDLDRCRPPSAVSLLESVRLLQESPHVVVILLADLPTLAGCVEAKYESVAARDMAHTGTGHEKSEGRRHRAADALEPHEEVWHEARTRMSGTFGTRYIQKFVQVQFDLPPISRGHVRLLLNHHSAPAPKTEVALGVPT
jgi:WD40 repeat protein